MDAAHKKKLAQGRKDARAVKAYLEFLETNKPKRGRRRTEESIAKRLVAIDDELATATALKKLNLIQERMDLQAELDGLKNEVSGDEQRAAFIEAAARYAKSKGITRTAFRQLGVDAQTLSEAGV